MANHSNLQRLLDRGISDSPAKLALQFEERRLTYADLDQQVGRLAGGLLQEGVNPGDRVALFLPNRSETVLTILACYRIAAVAVPLNYRYVAREARHVLELVKPAVLVHAEEKFGIVESVLDAIDGDRIFSVGDEQRPDFSRPFEELFANQALEDEIHVEEDQPALILFTSGSTGDPKGVVHSHSTAFAGIDDSRQIFDFVPSDTVLVGKSISHAGGLQTQLLAALLAGATVILAMKPTPAEAAALISRFSVTQYGMLASDLIDFVEYLETDPTPLPTLKNSIGSGDSVPFELHHRFRDLFGWQVMEGCGMTEIASYYAANPRYGTRKWGSLGCATPHTEVRVVDSQGKDLPTGETGEIVIRTPAATIGYWSNPDATRELFRDGWLQTGDLGRFDEDRYLWFVARKKLLIVRRGSNIAPAEVENVIDDHPQVHASVVVGVCDAEDGQVPVAWVVPVDESPPLSEESLRSFVAERLAGYKNPVRYLFLDEMPRTGTGKFDRHQLETRAAEIVG